MVGDPLVGPLPGLDWPPPGAFPPLWCAATGSRSAWKGLGRRWHAGLGRRALQLLLPGPRRFPGPWTKCSLRPLSPRGGTGPPCPRCDCQPERTVLSAPRPRRAARVGIGSRKRRQGSAAMSATHPTRLETRTKESNARASQRVNKTPWRNESEGRRAPAEVGSRAPRGPGAPPARLARTVGEVERERVR